MTMHSPRSCLTAIGLMSGTSLDGVDAALIETDGVNIHAFGSCVTRPYPEELRTLLRSVFGGVGPIAEAEQAMTLFHADVVQILLQQAGLEAAAVDVIGFHGQTILHRPEEGRTWQIGDGALLARLTGIPVVCDFRSADVAAGGQGAPLVPLFHAALCRDIPGPLAVLNLGGVGNVTYIGGSEPDDLLAFDTGPANAPLDDWILRHTGETYDRDGRLAATGRVEDAAVAAFLSDSYFERTPPKSLDRDDFKLTLDLLTRSLSPADGAATLSAMVAGAVLMAQTHFPQPVHRWLICGGGRHNLTLMNALSAVLSPAVVESADVLGWNGDALEAQAFGFLAVRSLCGLPLSLPGTTGVAEPTSGGVCFKPS